MTALRKPSGGVRGIATGDAFRRILARALAHEWAPVFDAATRPFQYANQVRATLELQPGTTLVSLDGRSAYDTISRASFLTVLRAVAPELLPFVRLFYGQPSTYCWWDAEGCCRDIQQGDNCEQGDARAPALFSLGQHGRLEQASSQLQRGERLLAFLDDLYILTPAPARASTGTPRPRHGRCGCRSALRDCLQ